MEIFFLQMFFVALPSYFFAFDNSTQPVDDRGDTRRGHLYFS
ncbi:MAG: hypothetical protein ABIH08_02330 [Candidatus Omnitrophota bacterium]